MRVGWIVICQYDEWEIDKERGKRRRQTARENYRKLQDSAISRIGKGHCISPHMLQVARSFSHAASNNPSNKIIELLGKSAALRCVGVASTFTHCPMRASPGGVAQVE